MYKDKAQAIVDDAKAVIDKTLTATADVEEKPSVMVLEPLGEDITNYGAKSLGGDMVTQLGATLANRMLCQQERRYHCSKPDVILLYTYMQVMIRKQQESQLAVIKMTKHFRALTL